MMIQILLNTLYNWYGLCDTGCFFNLSPLKLEKKSMGFYVGIAWDLANFSGDKLKKNHPVELKVEIMSQQGPVIELYSVKCTIKSSLQIFTKVPKYGI